MPPIVATYRLQLHAGFPLAAARAIVPYLHRLGVSHVHASPLLQARTGSQHGYDVTDPTRLNPELGTEAELEALVAELHAHGMGLVLDIVPNHMAASPETPAWEDVLTHGRASVYARWFDIDWRAAGRDAWSRLLLPVLGDARSNLLARGEIGLRLMDGRIRVTYYEQSYPLDPSTVPQLLTAAAAAARPVLPPRDPGLIELEAIVAELRRLPRRSAAGPAAVARRREGSAAALGRLAELTARDPALRREVAAAADRFGRGEHGPRRLRRLLDAQVYRLVHWRRAAREINYRRFFDVNDLVALHMEDPEVFAQTHARVLEWRSRGWIDGFRIDHPDGLLDPAGYFRRLGATAGEPAIFVEKILSHGEDLRPDWPVAGTTGYDFLNQAERLFVAPAGAAEVEREYHRVIRRPLAFPAVAAQGKRLILETALSAGVRGLAQRALRLLPPGGGLGAGAGRKPPSAAAVARAIGEVIVALPVYRTYVGPGGEGSPEDRRLLADAVAQARARGRADTAALDLVETALLGAPAVAGASEATISATEARAPNPGGGWSGVAGSSTSVSGSSTSTADGSAAPVPAPDPTAEQARVRFVQRFQQTSGPATAKGIEDTAFYRYAPLLSLNEVGGGPDEPLASAADAFHRAAEERAARWPAAMLTVTTHDTKRTADARARLDVLSEIPEEWAARVAAWRRHNLRFKRSVGGRRAPDPNTVYQCLQAMVAIWPEEPPDGEALADLRRRLSAYAVKAAREAKDRTSWTDPDEAFEAAVTGSVESLLSPDISPGFLDELQAFVRRIGPAGRWHGLARTLVQLASPGTPDLFQGDELWLHALVDPDNRRPVDFDRRRELLALVEAVERGGAEKRRDAFAAWLSAPQPDSLKLYLVRRALQARGERAELRQGSYLALRPSGEGDGRVIAFARDLGGARAIVLAPRLIARAVLDRGLGPTDPALWDETAVRLPDGWPGSWRCALSGGAVEARDGAVRCADAFRDLPVALLLSAG